MFPLKDNYQIADDNGPGSFGAKRRHDVHTGVDIYCQPSAEVYAMRDSIITSILDFTGPNAGSPWWEDTKCIMAYSEADNKTILYGELSPVDNLSVGDALSEGTLIGYVKRVLKKDKGIVPSTTMLHMELYQGKVNDCVWWMLEDEKPTDLLDVTVILK